MGHADVKINVGSGNEPLAGYYNLDRRRVPGVQAMVDVLHLPFASGAAAEVSALSLVEHFEDPYVVLDELTRVLDEGGLFVMLVPSPWSQSGLLDRTHVFLADLTQWVSILAGYFESVQVIPEGVRYRYNKPLVAIQMGLIHGLRMFEFAQAWRFRCTGKRRDRTRAYIPWWLEDRYGQQTRQTPPRSSIVSASQRRSIHDSLRSYSKALLSTMTARVGVRYRV